MTEKKEVTHETAINAAVQRTVIREAQTNLHAIGQTYRAEMAAHLATLATASDHDGR